MLIAILSLLVATADAPPSPAASPGSRQAPSMLPSELNPANAPLPTAEANGVKIVYQPLPYNPHHFAAVEHGIADRPAFKHSWFVAHVATTVPLTLEGTAMPPGNYAVVFHPKRDERGMLMEVRKIPAGHALRRQVIAAVPEGTVVYSAPVKWSVTDETLPRLTVSVNATSHGRRVTFHTGNRILVMELKRS